MRSRSVLPTFANEEEEVAWLDQNHAVIESEIDLAFEEGRMRRGLLVPPSQRTSQEATVMLNKTELDRAKTLAAKRHMNVQDYLETLVREGLQRDSDAA